MLCIFIDYAPITWEGGYMDPPLLRDKQMLRIFIDKAPICAGKNTLFGNSLPALRPRYAPYSALCPLGKCSNILLGAKRETYLIHFQ
jgi:hypothetical protein